MYEPVSGIQNFTTATLLETRYVINVKRRGKIKRKNHLTVTLSHISANINLKIGALQSVN